MYKLMIALSIRLNLYFVYQELEYQNSVKKKDRIANDRFVETMDSFVKVSNFSIQETEELHKEMEERVRNFQHILSEYRNCPFVLLLSSVCFAKVFMVGVFLVRN